jgi:hypothetical protein
MTLAQNLLVRSLAAVAVMRSSGQAFGLWPCLVIAGCLLSTGVAPTNVMARDSRVTDSVGDTDQAPEGSMGVVFDRRLHYVGEIWMSLSNRGSLGSGHGNRACPHDMGILRIDWCPSFEYPGGTRIDYLFEGGFWFGGVIDGDTLVSTAYAQSGEGEEFHAFARTDEDLPPNTATPVTAPTRCVWSRFTMPFIPTVYVPRISLLRIRR